MHPEFGDLLGLLEHIDLGLQHALEDSGQVTDVELLVEVEGGLLELVAHVLVQNKRILAEAFCLVQHVFVEHLEMV